MKKTKTIVLAVLILSIFLLSCAQDAIFHNVSLEPERKDPLIRGSPTNMVILNNNVYAASRNGEDIFVYRIGNGTGNRGLWSDYNIDLPEGSVGELATDGTHLYALIFPSGEPLEDSVIKRRNGSIWELALRANGYSIQSLYGAGGRIFAGGQSHDDLERFAIFTIDTDDTGATSLRTITTTRSSLLSGAAVTGGTIYLSTQGHGIYLFEDNKINGQRETGAVINGIIAVGDYIVAVSFNGTIYVYHNEVLSFSFSSGGSTFTGALYLWTANGSDTPDLLLMGIRGNGFSVSHGYLEMVLENGRPSQNIRTPGEHPPTSVESQPSYRASIGVHPVEAIMQISGEYSGIRYGGRPLIFASTASAGLWSYRDGEWNAED